MFVRVETGFKADFSDPEAKRIHRKVSEIQPSLGEKIRWVRKLNVVWMDVEAPRDKVVHAIQKMFKNSVTHWVFTGDLLPSAAGTSGTLYDLMQASPFRPGVFHGIEKRKRLQIHDEESIIIQDAVQTILGRKSPQDRVVTGEILLLEGAKLTQADLEWVARNWFAQGNDESWTLLSEEELKRNSRFQSEQVAKYLSSPQGSGRSRLLQFRSDPRNQGSELNWPRIDELLQSKMGSDESKETLIECEEWNYFPSVRFSNSLIRNNTQNQVEFQLCRHQLEHIVKRCNPRLFTMMTVLPEKSRIWRADGEGEHPIRIREDFERSLQRFAETTETPTALMKLLEEADEKAPGYFWSAGISVEDFKTIPKIQSESGVVSEIIYVGYSEHSTTRNLVYLETLKSVYVHGLRGQVIEFAIPSSGLSLLECLKRSQKELNYGFDIVLDGNEAWFSKYFEGQLPLGLIFGVHTEKKEWFIQELQKRELPFVHFGTTTLTGDVRILSKTEVKAKANIIDFFGKGKKNGNSITDTLLDEAVYLPSKRGQPERFRNRFSTEELVLKPETFHVSIATPLVVRPFLEAWSGLMVLGDLCGVEFGTPYLDYLLRKSTAMGGQIHSLQASYLNGLKPWSATLKKFHDEYGILVQEVEAKADPEVSAHWIALQVVSKVADVRNVRTEDFKFPNDRIYWLQGDFEHASTRWLSGFEGRYQGSLHSAVAIESTERENGVLDALTYALKKRKLGAEVRVQHHFPGGFFVSTGENDRFAVEEEWRSLGVNFEFVGRVTATPHLVLRNENNQIRTIAIEDTI